MTELEMIEAIKQINGLSGMTVNERLFASGFMNKFDKALMQEKAKAKKILELLGVDKPSIEKILA